MQNEAALQCEHQGHPQRRLVCSCPHRQSCRFAVQPDQLRRNRFLLLAYNILMFQGSAPSQFYLLLQPLQQQCPQVCLQPLFPSPSSFMWALSFTPTIPSVSALGPQQSQPPPQPQPAEALSLTSAAAEGGEGGAKGLRRAKGKRLRSRQKELQSAKKNSESNIVNQLFSFFNSYEKSECVVERAIVRLGRSEVQKVKSMFYNIVRLINYRRGRKYVNKDNILAYYTPARFLQQVPDITHKLAEVQLLTLEELCRLFRATTAHFLRNTSINAILTSKRITHLAKHEHLKRRRKVVLALAKQP